MAMQPLIHNSTARRMAKTILNGFRSYFADYLNSTLSAKARFEKADWHGVQQANVDRLELYKLKVAQTVQYLGMVTNSGEKQRSLIPSLYLTFQILKLPRHFLTRYSVIFMIMTRLMTTLSMFFHPS